MTDSNASNDQLDQILADFLAAQAKGEAPSPEKLMLNHPEFAGEIQAFLSNQNLFKFDKSTNIFTPIDPKKSPRIGNFKLLQRLGEGGMGEVWMADQEKPVRRRVAIKLIKPGMDSRAVLARFDAERQALALMNHPNIAKVFEAGIVGNEDQGVGAGRPYFVMELVKGIPVTEFCDQRRLPIRERLDLFRQSCSAVHHAHQKGIIHRDLKPSNILVESHDDRPVLKIIDFGLAKAIGGSQLTEQTLFTALGAIAGTPLYMAPEQAVLNAIDIDIRADVYSLGVLLYELLTGTTPLTKDSMHKKGVDELMKLIREYEAPKPSMRLSTSESLPSIAAMRQAEPQKLGRFVRGELDWIVMKALAKERERRYGSAMALSEDILRFLSEEPVQASPPSTLYVLQKFAKRHRGIAIAASAVTGALGLGMVGTTFGLMRAQHTASLERLARQESIQARDEAIEAREQAELEAYVANIALIQAAIENNDFDTAKRKLEACSEHLRGFEWEFLKRQTSNVRAVLPETSLDAFDNLYPYKTSVDEKLILVHVDTSAVQVFDLNGEPRSEILKHPDYLKSADFSPDATKIVTNCFDGKIRIWDFTVPEKLPIIAHESSLPRDDHEVDVTVSTTRMRFVVKEPSICLILDFEGRSYGASPIQAVFEEMSPDSETIVLRNTAGVCAWVDLKDAHEIASQSNCPDSQKRHFHAGGTLCGFASFLDQSKDSISTTLFSKDGIKLGKFEGELSVTNDGSRVYSRTQSNSTATTDIVWQLKDGEYFQLGTQIVETTSQNTGFEWRLGRSAVVSGDGLVAAVRTSQNRSISRLIQWNAKGAQVKESLPFLTGRGIYSDRNYDKVAVNSDESKVVFNAGASMKIACANQLTSIAFSIPYTLPHADGLAQKHVDFPFLTNLKLMLGEELASPTIWNESGEKLGEFFHEYTQLTDLPKSNTVMIDNVVLDRDRFDNGISSLTSLYEAEDVTAYVACEADAILESCNSRTQTQEIASRERPLVKTKSQKVLILKAGEQVAEIPTAATTPAVVVSDAHRRIFIADGRNVRIFSSENFRELASCRQTQIVRKIQASDDGRCIIFTFVDDSALAWDIRPLEEKQAYWKACADEFQPATEYCNALLLSDLPGDSLFDTIMKDDKLSARRRWGVVRLIDEAVAIDALLGKTLFRALKVECAFQKDRVLTKLAEFKHNDIHWRQAEHAAKLAKTWDPSDKSSMQDIENYCKDIIYASNRAQADYENSRLASKVGIDANPDAFTFGVLNGAAQYRLGDFESSVQTLESVPDSETSLKLTRRMFLAMSYWRLGDQAKAAELLKSIVMPSNASSEAEQLYQEASELITED